MRIAVLKELAPGERRVALVPENVARLVKTGNEVRVEREAGVAAGYPDAGYASAGARVCTAGEALDGAEVVVAVRRPGLEESDRLLQGTLLVALLQPDQPGPLLERLAARGVEAMAMEKVPRTTRAQAMDALSSQANLAGYKAVLVGAGALPRILPMMTTAAGTLAPAKVFVIGAGVAGLQALATARRLGAITSAFDVRAVVKEQVQSLGARFVDVPAVAGEGQGGYAKELDQDEQARVLAAIAAHVKDMDLVIATAQIPGKPAPRLLTAEMVRSMRPGSVVVDLAAETGGNCELTRAGETVLDRGVTVLGPVDLAATVPFHASQMYGRNMLTLLGHLAPKVVGPAPMDAGPAPRTSGLALDLSDEIVGAMLVVHDGKVR